MSTQEQAEDQQPHDEPDSEPTDDERLEQLSERIDKTRADAEEAGVIDDADQEYVDSGTTEEADDQTITPPG